MEPERDLVKLRPAVQCMLMAHQEKVRSADDIDGNI